MKPFIKWAGGKTQLLDGILPLIPREINNYLEPFLGGGALFLNIKSEKATISDINSELIVTWKVIKENKNQLIKQLNEHVKNHNSLGKEYFFKMREKVPKNLSNIEIASRFIYLNKTCFNGLYRVNRNNEFNVPLSKNGIIKPETLYSKVNINSISKFLNENMINIVNEDYKKILLKAQKGDFIFIDPPYDSDDNIFDSYTPIPFGKDGQKELAKIIYQLDKKKVKWILTNHNTKLIKKLYEKYNSLEIPANRFVNRNGDNRKNAVNEVIYFNYDLNQEQLRSFSNTLFFKKLKSSSYFLEEYVSWEVINERIESYKAKCHMDKLNLLFSKTEEEILKKIDIIFERQIWEQFSLLPLLLGKRLKKGQFCYFLDKQTETCLEISNKESVINFLKKSGLLSNLFLSQSHNDINSYLLGLEAGLTSNDKKNKSGKFMENKIAEILAKKILIIKNRKNTLIYILGKKRPL